MQAMKNYKINNTIDQQPQQQEHWSEEEASKETAQIHL